MIEYPYYKIISQQDRNNGNVLVQTKTNSSTPVLRAQDPFRSGQDNLEPIYDSSGIEIGTNFGSPGYTTVTMQDERKERSQNVV